MANSQVVEVRSFSRAVTQRVGALSDRFMALDRPLGEARVLWEIGEEGCEVRSLRSRLGLDSGHASRLLRALEADGLVRLEPGTPDRRIRVARLTRAGVAERALLDRRSDEQAESILEPLSPDRRDELVAAMRTVRRLMTGTAVEIVAVDPAGADARRCIRAYFAELERRSENSTLDPSDSIPVRPEDLVPPRGVFLVAYLNGEPIGCGGVKLPAAEPAEIKRLWVAESARGLGVGRRLLTELETHAVAAGARTARLDTNRALVEAIAMYRSGGYEEVAPFNDEAFAHHWFEKKLAG